METLAIFSIPRGTELLIILVVALLIFGRKLPELGRSLGRGLVEFKKGLKGVKDELDDVDREVKQAERRAELESTGAAKLEGAVHEKNTARVGERSDQPSTT